jgi:hypothetical protein
VDVTDFFLTYARWTAVVWLPPTLGLAIVTVWSFRSKPIVPVARPPVTELWLNLLVPAVGLLWGAVAYSYAAGPRGTPTPGRSHWAFHVLDAITLSSVLVTCWLTYRHRLRPAVSIPLAVLALAFALLAWFVASMSIGNDWI